MKELEILLDNIKNSRDFDEFENIFNEVIEYIYTIDDKIFENIYNIIINSENYFNKNIIQFFYYFITDNLSKAIHYLNQIIEINNNNINFLILSARLYLKKENYRESIKMYKKAITISPNNFLLHKDIACAYYDIAKYDEAILSVEKAMNLNSLDNKLHELLAKIYFEQIKYEEVARIYKKLLKKEPNNPNYHYKLGKTYDYMKSYEKAIESYRKAISISPENIDFYTRLREIYIITKKYNELIEILDIIVKLKPNILNYYYLIVFCIKEKRYERAVFYLETMDNLQDEKIFKKLTLYIQILNELNKNPEENNKLKDKFNKIIKNYIKEIISKDKNNNEYLEIFSYDTFNEFINIKFLTTIEVLAITIKNDIKSIKIYEEIAVLIDKEQYKKILELDIKKESFYNQMKHIVENHKDNKILSIKLKLSLLKELKKNINNNFKNNCILSNNISSVYMGLTDWLQDKSDNIIRKQEQEIAEIELQKEKEKTILRQNIMQAVSHTLGNMFAVQKAITKNLVGSDNLEEKVKRLELFQTITSSVLDSIKVAFGGNIENNIDFFNKALDNRISVYSIFYFALNINLDNLLKAAGFWDIIYNDFFKINKNNEDEVISLTDNIRNSKTFKILYLSDEEIAKFTNYFNSKEMNVVNDKFSIDINFLKDIYVEKESYTFAIIFTILQELVKNILKYGITSKEDRIIIKVIENNHDFTINFKNKIKQKKINKIGTLKGLEMIKLFSEIFGGFSKKIENNNFEIEIKIKKELFEREA